jgi:MFS family permease
MILDH